MALLSTSGKPLFQSLVVALERIEYPLCLVLNRFVGDSFMRHPFVWASRIGDGSIWFVVLCCLVLFHGALGVRVAGAVFIGGVIGGVFYRFVKESSKRERPLVRYPSIVCPTPPLDRYSFPSGHTLHAISFSSIIATFLPVWGEALYGVVLMIILSRVVLGLHYVSDVVVGVVAGHLVALGVVAVLGDWVLSF